MQAHPQTSAPATRQAPPLRETRVPRLVRPVRLLAVPAPVDSSNRGRRGGSDVSAPPAAQAAGTVPGPRSNDHPLADEFRQHILHVALDLRALSAVERSQLIDDLADCLRAIAAA